MTLPLDAQLARTSRTVWITLAGICIVYTLCAFIYLGNFQAPDKFWSPVNSEWATFDIGAVHAIDQVHYHHGLGEGEYELGWSVDGQHWSDVTGIKVDNRFAEFRWRYVDVNIRARFMRIRLINGVLHLNELALRDQRQQWLPANYVSGPIQAQALFDEQDKTVAHSTALNGMYFDEVYHARSAWEILQGINASENTHPPLGKIIISTGIALFGMNTFGFRVMGVLFGVLMLPVLFGIARRLFRSDNFALLATALFALDFMHLTQTRIATIDTYGVFFILASAYWMLRFIQNEPAQQQWRVDYQSLLWCGIFFGLGVASKWIVLYHGVGLALIYSWMLWRQFVIAKKQMAFSDVHSKIQRQIFLHSYRRWLRNTVLFSCLAFVVIPAFIYISAYVPFMLTSGEGLSGILANQLSMLNYHSNMQDTHPSSSLWYEWPVMAKAAWYYGGSTWTGDAKVSTIMAFGNPLIWYAGSCAFVAATIFFTVSVWCKSRTESGVIARIFVLTAQQQIALGFIVIGGVAQFLPWALIPRQLVFIYHFFASVPFIILALVWLLQYFYSNLVGLWSKYLPWLMVIIALILFVAYFPVISGLPVPRAWSEWLNKGPVNLYF